jgi:hypothetical protein
MAWTNISNALVSVGALPFATTIQALRDNPIAIANGDAGAPRVQTAGIAAGERMTTANVLGQTAGAALGAVGSYAFCRGQGLGPITAGATAAGSLLRYSSSGSAAGATPVGTWRAMGTTAVDAEATLYLRIS